MDLFIFIEFILRKTNTEKEWNTFFIPVEVSDRL